MRKITQVSALLAVLLFLTAGGLHYIFSKRTTATYAAEQITKFLDAEEQKFKELSSNHSMLTQLAHLDGTSSTAQADQLKTLENEVSSFFIFDNDRLTFWSNNLVEQPGKILAQNQVPLFQEGQNTYRTGIVPLPRVGPDHQLIYAIPVNLGVLPSPFAHIDRSIPIRTVLSTSSGVPILRDGQGHNTLFVRAPDHPSIAPQNLYWLILMYGMALIFLGICIMNLTNRLRSEHGTTVSTAFFITSTIGLRLLSIIFGFSDVFSEIPLFEQGLISSVLGQSLGDLMINSLLILWISIVLINQYHPNAVEWKLDWKQKILVSLAGYLAILCSLSALAWFCTHLILDSKINFNFESVLDLDHISVMAIICIIIIVFSIFLWSIKIASHVHEIGLSSRKKIVVGATAVLFAIPIVLYTSPGLPLLQFCIVALVFVLLLDLFTEAGKTNFSWIVLWLVMLSGFSSVLLYKINIDKDALLRTRIAQQLIDHADDQAVADIASFARLLPGAHLEDTTIVKRQQLRTIFSDETEYLRSFYQIDFPKSEVLQRSTTIDSEGLPVWKNSELLDQYIAILDIDDEKILTSFTKKKILQTGIFNQIPNHTFKGIDRLHQYVYAIYDKDGRCVERTSSDYGMRLNESPTRVGMAEIKYSSERSELIYSNGAQTVLVGRKLAGLIKPLSLFSYLFIIVVVTMLCMLLINCFIPYLPKEFNFAVRNGLSLRNRIQVSVLTLILLSFVIIGIATVLYFQNTETKNNLDRIKRTAASLQEELQSHWTYKASALSKDALEHIAIKYQTHINLYDQDGIMIQSSQHLPNGFQNKVQNRMKSSSIAILSNSQASMLPPDLYSKQIEPAYVAIRKDDQLMGYAGLPLQTSLSDAGDRVKDFMSTLLNVYVLLLLLAIFFALTVSRSITKPISELVNKIKAFKLGTSNEPLRWHTNDELGMLINEYNQMIFKLDESAQLLAQTEREVAWREMAKQVAHEIKNPLTPMKLSIQHLQYAMDKADLIESRQLVKRVAITLIEQIDNLSKIAEEFSRFAKMPKPETQSIVLNDLVTSVHDLFKKRDDMDFNLYVPIDDVYVLADKSHLLRVLNNLIKNAVQAIPASRRGMIDIKLERKGKNALLQVTDNGKGISSEMKDKVFYPNFTTKTSGTGLGLAISKNIIESFEGSINFETEENIGTTFSFEIPLAEGDDLRSTEPRMGIRNKAYEPRAVTIVEPISAGDSTT